MTDIAFDLVLAVRTGLAIALPGVNRSLETLVK